MVGAPRDFIEVVCGMLLGAGIGYPLGLITAFYLESIDRWLSDKRRLRSWREASRRATGRKWTKKELKWATKELEKGKRGTNSYGDDVGI